MLNLSYKNGFDLQENERAAGIHFHMIGIDSF